MSIFSAVSSIFSTALGKCLVVLAGACLVLGGLLLWERRNSADLSERIGGNEIVIAGQARALEEMERERANIDKALAQRETEHEKIKEELERTRAGLANALRDDRESAEWSATKLPGRVRDLLAGPEGAEGKEKKDAAS